MLCVLRSTLLVSLASLTLVSAATSTSSYSSHKNSEKDLVSAPSAYAKQVKRDDQPKFSIGLGTLSPSYTQKLGPDGKTLLNFDTDKNGFSYSISNVNHQTSLTQSPSENKAIKDQNDQNLRNHNLNPMNYYQPGQPNINVYHQQGYGAYPQQVNALAQMYTGLAGPAGLNGLAGNGGNGGYGGLGLAQNGYGGAGLAQNGYGGAGLAQGGPGMLPYAAQQQQQQQQQGQYGYSAYPGAVGGFGSNQGYYPTVSPSSVNTPANQIATTTAASINKPESKEDNRANGGESTTNSPTSGQLNTLPGGIFNYGFSQNHGLPQQQQNGYNYPMNFPINPFYGAGGNPSGPVNPAVNQLSANQVPSPNQAGSMGYGQQPFNGYGMDPYSMAAMSGYGGPSDAGGYGGYGGYPSGLGGSGMMDSASSPYASLFPFL